MLGGHATAMEQLNPVFPAEGAGLFITSTA